MYARIRQALLTNPHPLLVNGCPIIPNSVCFDRNRSTYGSSSIIAPTPPPFGPFRSASSYFSGEPSSMSLDLAM